MAAAVLGCILPFITVDNKACVSKTYPEVVFAITECLQPRPCNVAESVCAFTCLTVLSLLQFWLHCVRFAGLQLTTTFPRHVEPQQQLQQQLGDIVPCIILIGMRGSGKTSIGLALARSMRCDFYDCDECLKVPEAPEMKPASPNPLAPNPRVTCACSGGWHTGPRWLL